MAVSRYKLLAQLLALALFVALALWHYMMRHYDLILPPALLAVGLLVSMPLQWLGRLRPALADYLLLIGALILFAVEAPRTEQGMLWLGLPAVISFLLLSLPLALLLNVALVPAWLTLLGELHITAINLSMGWWLSLTTGLLIAAIMSRRTPYRLRLNLWRRGHKLSPANLQQNLKIEIARAEALNRPLSVLVLYIPQLDQADDQFGSQLRETLSLAFSEVVSHNSRHSDLLGEYRCNVFWLVLPNSGESGAITAAKRLSNVIAAISRPETGALESHNRVCTLQKGETATHFINRLDAAATKLLEPRA
ncbi:diguanylate cyclase domain-containing protein [Salinicola peritrichatus]|uniref:diguanylate cyclase domain-containing protein n=1 Tax=Salinicola peritrichatus TaxID=1267424 RepID=UPI000DA1CF09|nr:diguanylate cyclase [Salinicola peritrichatus]